jgi:hypothetical protein
MRAGRDAPLVHLLVISTPLTSTFCMFQELIKFTVPEIDQQNSLVPSWAKGSVTATGLVQGLLLLPLLDEELLDDPLLDEELLEELELELDELLLLDDDDELLEDELLDELELDDELLLLEEELPDELDELPGGSRGNMIGLRNCILAVFTVFQSPFRIPPVSPEFGFNDQNVQLIEGLAWR